MGLMTLMTSSDSIERCRQVPLHFVLGMTSANRKVKIRCPFHNERTPSCTLFPTGGFHCFGCGAHGNSVDFITKMGESFETAINELKKYI